MILEQPPSCTSHSKRILVPCVMMHGAISITTQDPIFQQTDLPRVRMGQEETYTVHFCKAKAHQTIISLSKVQNHGLHSLQAFKDLLWLLTYSSQCLRSDTPTGHVLVLTECSKPSNYTRATSGHRHPVVPIFGPRSCVECGKYG